MLFPTSTQNYFNILKESNRSRIIDDRIKNIKDVDDAFR